MQYIKVFYKNHRMLLNIIFLIISISITLGLIVSLTLNNELVDNIYNLFLDKINNYNSYTLSNFLYPIISYLLIIVSSISIIGCFMPLLSIFIENMSIGLLLGILIRKQALKGLLYCVIYFIITKLIYMLILIYLTISIYKFIKTLLTSLKDKNNESIYKLYSKILIKLMFSIIFITVINILNIFIAPYIFHLFIFLL